MALRVHVNRRSDLELLGEFLGHDGEPVAHEDELRVLLDAFVFFLEGSSLLPAENSAEMTQEHEECVAVVDDAFDDAIFPIKALQ